MTLSETVKIIGFIPCTTNLFAIYVHKTGKETRERVHAFAIEQDNEFGLSLQPMTITDSFLDVCSDAGNFAGLIDEGWTEEEIHDLVESHRKFMEKREAERNQKLKR